MSTRVKIAASAVGILAASAAVAAAQSSVSGNAQAIAFDRAAVAAENRAPGYTATQQGFLMMRSRLSADTHSIKLNWGSSVVPPGWAAVGERLTFAQQNGVVSWITDQLTPRCTPGSDCSANAAAEVLVDFYGVYVRLGAQKCYRVYAGLKTPYPATGVAWWVVGGDFLGPPRIQGADTVIEYSYPYGKQQTAQETDTIVTATKAFRSGVVRVANGTRARAPWAFTFSAQFTQLAAAPLMPKVTVCS